MAALDSGSSDYNNDILDTAGTAESTNTKTDWKRANGHADAITKMQAKMGVSLNGNKANLETRLLVGIDADGKLQSPNGTDLDTRLLAAMDAAGLLKLSDVIQIQYATINTVSASLSTTIPYDDSFPEKTEGTEVLTKAFTPKAATSILEIVATIHLSADAADEIIVALFQDTITNSLGASVGYVSAAEKIITVTLRHLVVAASTSARTYKVHAGGGSQPLVMNGITPGTPARILGGALVSSLLVTEWQV